MFQAHTVAALLRDRVSVACELVTITTSGDRLSEASLADIGGKNVFVKEIEQALADQRIDLAVHSSKDLPAVLPKGFVIAAVLPRDDPRDAVVLADGEHAVASLDELIARLGPSPRIGTSSVRRAAFLAQLMPEARFEPIRGNVGTRVKKLDGGQFDAIVLAAAGLRRLDLAHRVSLMLPSDTCVPAPGQGLIAVEVREDDATTRAAVARVDDAMGSSALTAERAVVERLGGGCQMPIGAYAAIQGTHLSIVAVVASLDGSRQVRATAEGARPDARAIGMAAAEQLLAQGAGEMLDAMRLSTRRSEDGAAL